MANFHSLGSQILTTTILLVALCSRISAWSPNKGFSQSNEIGRRSMIETVTTAATGSLLFSPRIANSKEPIVADPTTFDTYNIIPDSSAKLDPKLKKVNNQKLLRSLANSKGGGSIWLGEHHNSKSDHDFQERFIRMLHKERQQNRRQQPMAIGLEQVQVQFQGALDDYVGGRISLEEMRRMVDWEKRWMWNFEGYQGVFEAAKELQIRLLALNVDSEDLAKVEKGGYPGLPITQLRKYIKDPIGFGTFTQAKQFKTYVDYVIEPSYEIHQKLGLLKYSIAGEKMESEMPFRNFLSGRILWDEGMASAAYSWVSNNSGGLLVGLVGADHVKFCNGIPGRFARMAGSTYDCTSVVINPTLIDSMPAGSVASVSGSASSKTPEMITLQLRYLKDGIDPISGGRPLPESTGGVLPFADYIVVT